MRIFDSVLHFARNGSGDVAMFHGELAGALRLRAGDYRVLFTLRTIPCAYLAFDIAAKRTDDEAVADYGRYFGASGVIPPAVLAASLAAFIFFVSSAFCTQPSAVSMSFLY